MLTYHATLHPACVASVLAAGNFRGSQEVVVAAGPWLRLWAVRGDALAMVWESQTWSAVTALATVRLTPHDLLAVTSDLGVVVLLQWKNGALQPVSTDYVSRSGLRRTAPMAALAADPNGRAIMTCAVELTALCHVVSDGQLGLAIETSRPGTTIACAALDVGYDNPMFATLHPDRVSLSELDLGLNRVMRRKHEPATGCALLALPAGTHGPGGVLVLGPTVSWHHPDHSPVHTVLPAPAVAGAVHRMKNSHFALVHTADGNLHILTVHHHTDVDTLVVSGISAVPYAPLAPARAFAMLRSGHLVLVPVAGGVALHQLESLEPGEDLLALVEAPVGGAITTALLTEGLLTVAGPGRVSRVQRALPVEPLVLAPLPATADRVFTTAATRLSAFHQLLVLSFADATLVLAIGDSVEEVEESGFATTVPTLAVVQMDEALLVQVHSGEARVVVEQKCVSRWTPPPGTRIVAALGSNQQLAVALSNRDVVVLAPSGTLLVQSGVVASDGFVTCVGVARPRPGETRARFLAVGLDDHMVRLVDLETPGLPTVALQALSAAPSSVGVFYDTCWRLHTGLSSGVYSRSDIDALGAIGESRARFLGIRPVQVADAVVCGRPAVLAFSTKTWTEVEGRTYRVDTELTAGCFFSSSDCPEGLVGVAAGELHIVGIKRLEPWVETETKVEHVPRALVNTPSGLVVASSSTTALSLVVVAEDSSVSSTTTLESPLSSACVCLFPPHDGSYLVVGTAPGLAVYRQEPTGLVFLHGTAVEHSPTAMVAFRNGLLVAVGTQLRIYTLGQRQLLRKCLTTVDNTSRIVRVVAMGGDRVAVGDARGSVTVLHYQPHDNRFVAIALDVVLRHVLSLCCCDYRTVAGSDKHGGVWVLRLSEEALALADEYGTGNHRLECVVHMHTGDVATLVVFGLLTPGGEKAVVYTGVLGSVGALVPVGSRHEGRFLRRVEEAARERFPSCTLRLQAAFRSAYAPEIGVVDGDLVETAAGDVVVAAAAKVSASELAARVAAVRDTNT